MKGEGRGNSARRRSPHISRRGWRVIGAGAATACLGYGLLLLCDPAGQNWASFISPALILAGYASVGVGTILRDPA